MNKWKKIWNEKTADNEILLNGDKRAILLELKRSNGFDVAEGMSYEAFCSQYEDIKKKLQKYNPIKSVYEVGCGSGANLYLFENEGTFSVGGVDFSSSLVQLAEQVLRTQDILCAEAIDLPTEKKYDAVFSNSVFSYFENEGYAERVLEKMIEKANCGIGLIDIHNIDKKDEFVSYRRKIIKDYDKRYADLPKLFYSKHFFESFAAKHQLLVEFSEQDMEGYWNNQFVFSCYMYKK